MRIILTFLFIITSMFAQSILVINSNKNIEKYKLVEESFKENFHQKFEILDLNKMSNTEIKEYLYDIYPDIVYTIGSKAYKYANLYIPEKTLFFSSIVNYKRLNLRGKRFGVSNEVYSGMNLTLIKAFFPDINKLSIIYSDYTKDLFFNFKLNAYKMGIEIKGQKISSKNNKINQDLIKNSDGFIIIADPELIKNQEKVLEVFRITKRLKKPIFAYNELFIKFGAIMSISADDSTIGRQVSLMIDMYLKNQKLQKFQKPMGTNIIFNKKVADFLKIKYSKRSLSMVDKVIE